MKLSRHLSRVLVSAFCLLAVHSKTNGAERVFAHPDRIRYDEHCLTIDGHDTFIYSGAFHYFRCPQELWADRFTKIKAAGFNTVETYIPWDRTEPNAPAGLDDFSKVDLSEVDAFLTMAESFGLNIIIRPGPYICAEWNRGALPAWLLQKRPAALPLAAPWFRTDDPVYLAWSRHWFDAVCPVIARHQITKKSPGQPGVILFQIENEYDYSGFSDKVRNKNLAALSDEAVAKGIDVPLFTCWTSCVRGSTQPAVARAFDSCNFYVSYGVNGTSRDLQKLRQQQPNAPLMVTEQQGGWFTAPGDRQPLRPDADVYRADIGPNQIQNLELNSIAQGVTLTNFYMLFGGTNLGFSDAGYEIATCYDYSAPIRECGGVGEKYDRVKAIGEFLHQHGERLTRSKMVDVEVKADQKDVGVVQRTAGDGSRYFFIRTFEHDQPRKGTAVITAKNSPAVSIQYDLEPFGSKVFYLPPNQTDVAQGEWWPKAAAPMIRPPAGELPASITVTQDSGRPDTLPTQWESVNGKSAVALGIGDRRLIYYHAVVSIADPPVALTLVADVDAIDRVSVTANGTFVGRLNKGKIDLGTLLSGSNKIDLVYDNAGYANFDSAKTPQEKMERMGGITGLRLVKTIGAADSAQVKQWRMHLLDPATTFVPTAAGFTPDAVNTIPELSPEFDDSTWARLANKQSNADQLRAKQVAAFRGIINVTANQIKSGMTTLNIARMDDGGWAYVNGQLVGRGTKWDQTYSFNATKALKPGANSIVIIIRNEDGVGGVGAVGIAAPEQLVADLSSSLQWSDQSAGAAGDWYHSNTDDNWTNRPLPEPSSKDAAAVEWRRLSFQLPAAKPSVWVPWLLRLNATADATLSLNGHPIGRYPHGTPQSDYFLPECWLTTGESHPNVITLQLHRADQPIAIESAEIKPYTVYVEKR